MRATFDAEFLANVPVVLRGFCCPDSGDATLIEELSCIGFIMLIYFLRSVLLLRVSDNPDDPPQFGLKLLILAATSGSPIGPLYNGRYGQSLIGFLLNFSPSKIKRGGHVTKESGSKELITNHHDATLVSSASQVGFEQLAFVRPNSFP